MCDRQKAYLHLKTLKYLDLLLLLFFESSLYNNYTETG